MTKADQKLILILLLIGLLTFAFSKFISYTQEPVSQSQVVIKVSGEHVETVSLQAEAPLQRYIITGKVGKAIVETEGLKVRMLEAPCPDQICVKQGWINNPQRAIICVPNEVVIYLEAESIIDATTG